MSEGHDQDKTEEATPFRLRKAREKGQVARGMDLGFVGGLLAAIGVGLVGAEAYFAGLAQAMRRTLGPGLSAGRDPVEALVQVGALYGFVLRPLVARRPVGMPVLDDFAIVERAVPHIDDGELLIRARYLSVDPLQRVRMAPSSTYGQTMPLGGAVWGRMVGKVVDSRNPDYRVGEFVEGMLGWSEYAVSDGGTAKAEYAPGLTRVDPDRAPMSTALGILGMPGVTAYFSLLEIGQPQAGETVLVSAAAGMVGSLAGQIARIKGCRVVGIVGGEAKARYVLDDLGFDAAIDYKAGGDMVEAIRAACPSGVDIYMDNVGGPIRDAALRALNRRARVPLVGRISQMHDASPMCPDPQVPLMHARARMEGFIVYDYEHRAEEAWTMIATWLRDGEIRYRETITHGIESAPSAFISMLGGGNIGKQIVKV